MMDIGSSILLERPTLYNRNVHTEVLVLLIKFRVKTLLSSKSCLGTSVLEVTLHSTRLSCESHGRSCGAKSPTRKDVDLVQRNDERSLSVTISPKQFLTSSCLNTVLKCKRCTPGTFLDWGKDDNACNLKVVLSNWVQGLSLCFTHPYC